MKIQDVNALKGQIKCALNDWAGKKIEELFPEKAHTRYFLKNGIRNLLHKQDERINGIAEKIFLFAADEKGDIDSDTLVDSLAGIFEEMKKKRYDFGFASAMVGNGQLVLELSGNILTELLFDAGRITFTKDDLLEMKDYFKKESL